MRAAGCWLAVALIAASAGRRAAQSCPAPLGSARRLVLVTAERHDSTAATMRALRARLRRPSRGARGGAAEPAMIGHERHGLGAMRFVRLRASGEPMKVEGDKRAPAGFYRIGRSFGFARVGSRRAICASPTARSASTIRPRRPTTPSPRARRSARRCTARTCGACREYARGLLVDYPTDAHGAGRLLHLHPRLRLPGRPAPAAASRCRSRSSRRLQDFAERRRGAGGPAAAGARPLQGLPAGDARQLIVRSA